MMEVLAGREAILIPEDECDEDESKDRHIQVQGEEKEEESQKTIEQNKVQDETNEGESPPTIELQSK